MGGSNTHPKPPFPADVRARLDPALFRCDDCGGTLEYPGRWCWDCRGRRNRERSEAAIAACAGRRRGGRGFPPSGTLIRIPRTELEEFQRYFGVPPTTLVQVPNMRADPCAYCGAPGPNTLDHIVPLAAGNAANYWDNATACCLGCNTSKGKSGLFAFLATRPWLRRGNAYRMTRQRNRQAARMERLWKRYEERQQRG